MANQQFTTQTVVITIEEYKQLLSNQYKLPNDLAIGVVRKTEWQILEEDVRVFFDIKTRFYPRNKNTLVGGIKGSSLYNTWRSLVTLKIGSYSKWFTSEEVQVARDTFEEIKSYLEY